jgi:hypothetical protein
VSTLDKLDSLQNDPEVADYVTNEFGGVEQCRKDILCMFFKIAREALFVSRLSKLSI